MVLKNGSLVAVMAAAVGLPFLAQGGGRDTISALLAEVHELRIAMEHNAAVSPQIQLLGARLTVQNERLARATSNHDSVQEAIENVTSGVGRMSARLQELEAMIASEPNQTVQRQLVADQRELKAQMEVQSAEETRLRARESELAGIVAAEQNRWAELNTRLDELERSLAKAPR